MNNSISEVSEIQVSYKPNKVANSKITGSYDAVEIIRKAWDNSTLEMQEEVKIILLNQSNIVLGTVSYTHLTLPTTPYV